MIPMKKAIFQILFSTLVISGIPWLIFGIYTYLWVLKLGDPQYTIAAIIQEGQGIKTEWLSKLMGLSEGKPVNLYQFDAKKAQKKLEKFPAIQSASINKIFPQTLYIQYELRKPFAFVEDIPNAAIDREGILFPYAPYFSSKKLPILMTGVKGLELGKKIPEEFLALIKTVLAQVPSSKEIKIDASHTNEMSLGQQRLVVAVGKHVLILDPTQLQSGLKRYQQLLSSKEFKIMPSSAMIDLRLQHLAYLNLSH